MQKEYAEASLDIALKCYIYNAECKEFLSRTMSKFLLYWSEFHHELTFNINGPYTFSKSWQVNNAENISLLETKNLELKPEIENLKNVCSNFKLLDDKFLDFKK